MKTVGSALVVFSVFAGMATLGPATGHDWYPLECCNQMDCAPVESIAPLASTTTGDPPQLVVTSKHSKAIIRQDFPVRESRDSRIHVCMRRHDFGDMDVICFFIPPGA
jgi:hypothetical protein